MHPMTDEDYAALGHFVRRWAARGRTMRHASMIARPEQADARVMAIQAECSRQGYRPAAAAPMAADWLDWQHPEAIARRVTP